MNFQNVIRPAQSISNHQQWESSAYPLEGRQTKPGVPSSNETPSGLTHHYAVPTQRTAFMLGGKHPWVEIFKEWLKFSVDPANSWYEKALMTSSIATTEQKSTKSHLHTTTRLPRPDIISNECLETVVRKSSLRGWESSVE